MPRWFARDRSGHVAVFEAEHVVPPAARGLSEEALDLTEEIVRLLRTDQRPVRGRHVSVQSGVLHLLASLPRVQAYASEASLVREDVVRARFAARPRGREANFMAGIRTFGAGEAEPTSALDRAHADGVCGGCIVDPDGTDGDEMILNRLGLFSYRCDDEDLGHLYCDGVPGVPLEIASLGALGARCLRFAGEFATTEQLALDDLAR